MTSRETETGDAAVWLSPEPRAVTTSASGGGTAQWGLDPGDAPLLRNAEQQAAGGRAAWRAVEGGEPHWPWPCPQCQPVGSLGAPSLSPGQPGPAQPGERNDRQLPLPAVIMAFHPEDRGTGTQATGDRDHGMPTFPCPRAAGGERGSPSENRRLQSPLLPLWGLTAPHLRASPLLPP